LIATDDNKGAENLTRFLVSNDITVLRAHNVPECVEIIRTHALEVVVLDEKMPGVDPARVAAELRRGSFWPVVIPVNGDDSGDDLDKKIAQARRGGTLFEPLPADPPAKIRISDHARLLTQIRALVTGYRNLEQELNG
jgi:CheY-like chemotaxis protein